MSQVTELPLNSGQDQGVDRILLGTDKLALAQNCRLARDGRLEVRPNFTALSSATMTSAAVTVYDVANFAGRLVALGDQLSASRATDVFEWVGRASKWKGTAVGLSPTITTGTKLPQLTDVRQVGSLPDQAVSVRSVALAGGAGYLCAAVENADIVSPFNDGTVAVHVFDPTTDQTLLLETVNLRRPKVVFAGTTFWVFGVGPTNEDVISYSFDPLADETLQGPVTRVTNAVQINDLALVACGTGMLLVYGTTASVPAIRYNSAGVSQASFTASATAASAVDAACNAAGSLLTVVRATALGVTTATTFNAAGTLQSGPTTMFGGSGASLRLGAELSASTGRVTVVIRVGSDAHVQDIVQATHVLDTDITLYNANWSAKPATVSNSTFGFAVSSDSSGGVFLISNPGTLLPQAGTSPQLSSTIGPTVNVTMGTPAVIGTKLYWPTYTSFIDDGLSSFFQRYRFAIYEAETRGTDRRQMTQVGGELLIAGGLPLTYGGRTLVEQGFVEAPRMISATQGAAGQLTALGRYNAIAVWEVFDDAGRLLHSKASLPREVNLSVGNNSVSWVVTTPHSLRCLSVLLQNLAVRVSLYRTEANEGVFFLDTQGSVDSTVGPGQSVTLVSSQSDALLIDNLVLYEQSQTPVSHVAPTPYRYSAPARERAFAAGLPEDEAWTFSKLLFPAEPVEWAPQGRLGFTGRVGQPITAVAAFETVGLAWTAQEVWQIPGRGPEHDGTGEFDAAAPIASPGGCSNWRSVIVTPAGAFFQMREDMIMLLTRGGDVQWIGLAVQDTLALFPTIVGAVFVRALDQVVFACNNLAGTAAVFLVYDLIKGQWFVDTIDSAITSVSELDGRLVYVSGGTVFLQDADIASGVGALPAVSVRMGSLRPFSALGYGDIVKLGILGTYLGDCTVEAFISYDDGQTWTSLGPQAVTAAAWTNPVSGAAIASGDPVTLLYTPNIRTVDRFAFRVDITNAVNTGGLRLHVVSFEVEAQQGTARKPARDQR